MKILLINPFFPTTRIPDKKKWHSYFPIGIGYVAGYLRSKGIEVEVLDTLGECLSIEETKERIMRTKFNAVGITGMSSQYLYVKGLAAFIKKYLNVPVILGGALSTYSFETVLKNTSVDICVFGEGEITAFEILNNLNNLSTVRGIAFKDGDSIKVTDLRSPNKNRDIFPFPAYDLFDMDRYGKISIYSETRTSDRYAGIRTAYLVAGTGCPFKCHFCSKNLQVGYRSVDNIIEEMKYLIEQYNVQGFHFGDELLIINRKRMLEFAEKVNALNILWAGQARVDTVDRELLEVMKNSGCVAIGYGIESGSQELLNAMNKGITLQQIENAMKWAMDIGLEIKVQLMMGYPGENRITLQKTVDLFKRLGHPGRRFNLFTPLPGSKVYEDCLRNGLIKDEESYLSHLSRGEFGFISKKVLLNFSSFSDEELMKMKRWAEKEMRKNFNIKLLRNPICLIKHIYKNGIPKLLGRIRKISNPVYLASKLRKKKFEKIVRQKDIAHTYFLWADGKTT